MCNRVAPEKGILVVVRFSLPVVRHIYGRAMHGALKSFWADDILYVWVSVCSPDTREFASKPHHIVGFAQSRQGIYWAVWRWAEELWIGICHMRLSIIFRCHSKNMKDMRWKRRKAYEVLSSIEAYSFHGVFFIEATKDRRRCCLNAARSLHLLL